MARLLLFAAAREAAGCRVAALDGSSVGEVIATACERFGPGFARILRCATVLVEGRTVRRAEMWGVAVGEETEVAVLPPVSGGQDPPLGATPEREPGTGSARVRMIDVAVKPETAREAVAVCRLTTTPAVRERLLHGEGLKGDAVAAAQVAGVLAAKRTPELIPLCHPVRTTSVEVTCAPCGPYGIKVQARVRGIDRTGFEMEALAAAVTAALTLFDMGKAEDPTMSIETLRVVAKSGGASGEWRSPWAPASPGTEATA